MLVHKGSSDYHLTATAPSQLDNNIIHNMHVLKYTSVKPVLLLVKAWLTSRTTVAACLRTSSSGNLRQVRILGKTSASTTTSAMSTLCLAIWARAQHTCLFSLGSWFSTRGARYATAPAYVNKHSVSSCSRHSVNLQQARFLGSWFDTRVAW